MESSSVLIDVILILLVAVPLVYLVVFTTGAEKKAKREVIKLCKNNGLHLNNFEITGNLILGTDDAQKKLIVSNRKQIETNFEIIDLSSLSDCRVKTVKPTKNTTDWVGLELVNNNSKVDISFYKEGDEEGPYIDPQACIQKALKWEKLIQPMLRAS